ncbi:GNAT family N-acetyltransferase [Paenibacillus selenitireducens]|uniref:GNAT family N-acetyltransferase n=1 Tax=Paenibacillus selenitireducens TaxID=1324314 RepID=A0A1T2XN30_9BACL|nr:GNAT family N-acetyltransferase [Paenibacillus selenitireducens]OPA81279.1 GNAT family N-acetyltransferase [Paenibacillus selenitireducens]
MLETLKDRLHEEDIQELIGYSVFPDPDRLTQVIDNYKKDDQLHIYGEVTEGETIGFVGFTMNDNGELTLQHIAVRPEDREHGYGRGMMLELIGLMNPASIQAETDEEAVDFYRNIGFTAYSLGEKYPGVERFRCEYIVDEE